MTKKPAWMAGFFMALGLNLFTICCASWTVTR